jgi:hypothetical protein
MLTCKKARHPSEGWDDEFCYVVKCQSNAHTNIDIVQTGYIFSLCTQMKSGDDSINFSTNSMRI